LAFEFSELREGFLKKFVFQLKPLTELGPSWSYGSWIYNYLCSQCLSPLMLWVRISIRAMCTTLIDKVCQWLATGRWFSPGPPVSSTNKTVRHDITEILLKLVLNTIKQTIYLRLLARSHTFYAIYASCSIFHTYQIRANDNSSTCTFTTGRSYWWNNCNNNIVFACMFILFWIFWVFCHWI
jgi:hypothetical protein